MAAVRVDVIGLLLGGLMLAASACGSHSARRSTDPDVDTTGNDEPDDDDGSSTPSGRPSRGGSGTSVDPGVAAGPSEGGWATDDVNGGGKTFGGAGPTTGGADDEPIGGAGSVSIDIALSTEPVLLISERAGTGRISVSLSAAPSANVLVLLASSAPLHARVTPSELLFTPKNWADSRDVEVRGIDDHAMAGDSPLLILTAPAKSNDVRYDGIDPEDVKVLVLDETAAGVVVSHDALSTTEAGGTAQFAILLNSKPKASVTFPLSSSDATEGAVPKSLTIEPEDWAKPQFVTITGIDDIDADGDTTYQILIGGAESDDPAYAGRSPSPVAVTNVDNE